MHILQLEARVAALAVQNKQPAPAAQPAPPRAADFPEETPERAMLLALEQRLHRKTLALEELSLAQHYAIALTPYDPPPPPPHPDLPPAPPPRLARPARDMPRQQDLPDENRYDVVANQHGCFQDMHAAGARAPPLTRSPAV